MLRLLLSVLFLTITWQTAKSQSIVEIDSLLQKSSSTFYSNPESARVAAFMAKQGAERLDYTKGVQAAIRLIGITHDIQGQTDSSRLYFEYYYQLSLKEGDTDMITSALINLCMLNWNVGQFQEALNYGFESIKSAESNNNEQLLSKCFNNVALIYQEINDYTKAIPYNKKSYRIREKLGDKQGIVHSQNNLGICYKNLQIYDSAKFFYESAKTLAKEINDQNTISKVNNNLGVIAIRQGAYNLAEKLLYEALAYDQSALQNILTNNSLAELFLETGAYEKALSHSMQSKLLLDQIDNQDHKEDVYYYLANSLAKNNQTDSAAFYFNRLLEVKESIFNEKSARVYNDLEVSYQTDKKEQQIALQEAKLQRNRILLIALLVILFLIIVLFIISRNQLKRKQLLIQKEAELKVREAEINAVINSQEKERNRFARDLHDGFGQLISVLKLNLSQLKDYTSKDLDKRQEVYKNGESVINEMYTELRNICFDLMPQTLIKKGLSTALKELGERISKSTGVVCEVLIFDNQKRLTEIEEVSLFRITQEWINNILKYAAADSITIQLTQDNEELTLTIEDNGIGFDDKQFFNGKGNGWKNIQTRLNLISGEFHLDSNAGMKGTMVTVNLHLRGKIIPANTDKEMTTD